jgi:hypothetical protein
MFIRILFTTISACEQGPHPTVGRLVSAVSVWSLTLGDVLPPRHATISLAGSSNSDATVLNARHHGYA